VLILGSLPGRMSLEKQQYYGQPRNAFWPIMGTVCGADPRLDYLTRIRRLEEAGVALWDVLAAAHRPGSLDSAIAPDTIEINDFAALFALCPGVRGVFLNGLKAAYLYRRMVLPTLPPRLGALPLTTLPSTSPAYAGMPQARKLELWSAALEPLLGRSRGSSHRTPRRSADA
jgi:hypoxanthine-DNA glycosylase